MRGKKLQTIGFVCLTIRTRQSHCLSRLASPDGRPPDGPESLFEKRTHGRLLPQQARFFESEKTPRTFSPTRAFSL